MSDDDAPLRRQAAVMFNAKVARVGYFWPKKEKKRKCNQVSVV